MRIEFYTYHKPAGGHQYEQRARARQATQQAAANRTDVPRLTDWRAGGDPENLVAEDAAGGSWLIVPVEVPENENDRIELAVKIGFRYGGCEGDHHKMWTIDQMIRVLAGDRYETFVAEWEEGEDGPETYSWDEGVAP